MKELVHQILEVYFKKMREPNLEELSLQDESLQEKKGCCFVTLYLD